MIALLILQSGYALGGATIIKDRDSYRPYRECVLERARVYATTSETVDNIRAAALSDCRSKKALVILDVMSNGLDYANSHPDALEAPNGSARNLDEMDKVLEQDVAAAVLRVRIK